jgi:preprotein translocase subunit SecA
MEEGVPIEHGMVSRAIERAQRQVEAQNFSVRKHLLEYDDVMNKQRESVYTLRREVLEGRVHLTEEDIVDTREYMLALAEEILDAQVERFAGKDVPVEDWDVEALAREAAGTFALDMQDLERLALGEKSPEEMGDAIWGLVKANYEVKEKVVPAELLRRVERDVMLQIVDTQWKDHLYSLDHLKEGIGLRGYGQRDPLVEYKKESFALFQDMKGRIEEDIVRYLFRLKPVLTEEASPIARPAPRRAAPLTMNHPQAEPAPAFAAAGAAASAGQARSAGQPRAASPFGGSAPRPARTGGDDVVKTVRREEPKVGRNDPCPCGSGKKYKKCHGQAA